MKLNTDPQWLREMAQREDNGCTSVGGLLSRMTTTDDDPVTFDFLRQLPGITDADQGGLDSPLLFRSDILDLSFTFEGDQVRCWAITDNGCQELRCDLTRSTVLVLLSAFGPPVTKA